jgi:hypothetical protein
MPIAERMEYWSDFDWERKRPKGRRLGDRGVMNAERDQRTYYVLHVREEYAEVSPLADELVRRVLTCVDEYASAGKLSRCEEMSIELPLPPKKAPPQSDDPDFF